MEAGAELDKLVAEKVMGWRYDEDWKGLVPPEQKAKPGEMWTDWQTEWNEEDRSYRQFREPIREHHVSGLTYSGDSSRILVPEWSKDMSAAWRVVERMRKPDPSLRFLMFKRWWKEAQLWALSAEEAALEICKAALRIMEGRRDDGI